MKTIHVHKAFRNETVVLTNDLDSTEIRVNDDCFKADAEAINLFLQSAIPSGTYDQLVKLMDLYKVLRPRRILG